jgi:hypothetical protein
MSNMLENYPRSGHPAGAKHTVTHAAIAARARELWVTQGCPDHCDQAVWLEAEAELIAIHEKRFRHPHLQLTH